MEFATVSLAESLLLLPMTILFIFACIPLTIKVLNSNKEPSNNLTILIASVGLLIAAFFTRELGAHANPVFFGALIFDKMAVLLNYGIIAITFFTLLISINNPNTTGESLAEHTFLVMCAAVGMMTLASSADLMVLFIGLELMSIALYVLIGLGHEQKFSKEASFKYFILGSFASALLLYGIAFLFGSTGTTQIYDIGVQSAVLMGRNQLFFVGVCMVMIGICFKISVFPFHAWTPDVYQGAPTSVTAFMATGVKLVMFAVFVRLALNHFFWGNHKLVLILQILAIATMVVGNFSALLQENIKRVLAYSSIAHAGYMMIGIVVTANSHTPEAATAVLFYVLSYSVMNLGAFAIVSLIEKEERGHQNISDYAGLGFKYPFLGLAMTVFMLSMAGMPPTVGFIGKFYIFSAALKDGYVWLAVIGVINSLVSAYYYLKVIVSMYMKEPLHEVKAAKSFAPRFVIAASLILVFLLGIISTQVYAPVYRSVTALLASGK